MWEGSDTGEPSLSAPSNNSSQKVGMLLADLINTLMPGEGEGQDSEGAWKLGDEVASNEALLRG